MPGSHGEHIPPLGPVKPVLHLQADDPVLPAGELESAVIHHADQIHCTLFNGMLVDTNLRSIVESSFTLVPRRTALSLATYSLSSHARVERLK